jgi:hypothetical protein
VPVAKLPLTQQWVTDHLLPDVAYPFLARAFAFALPDEAAASAACFRVVRVPSRVRLICFTNEPGGASYEPGWRPGFGSLEMCLARGAGAVGSSQFTRQPAYGILARNTAMHSTMAPYSTL